MSLDLDPLTCDGGVPASRDRELDRIVRALAGGDAAFVLTLVERFGAAIAAELRAAGPRPADLDEQVHDVAFLVLGAPIDPADDPWSAVRDAARRVARRRAGGDAPVEESPPRLLGGRIAFGITPSCG